MGKAKTYVATTEQVWAIHDAVPDHLRVAVLLGAFAGLRVSRRAAGVRRGFHPGSSAPKTAVAGQA